MAWVSSVFNTGRATFSCPIVAPRHTRRVSVQTEYPAQPRYLQRVEVRASGIMRRPVVAEQSRGNVSYEVIQISAGNHEYIYYTWYPTLFVHPECNIQLPTSRVRYNG